MGTRVEQGKTDGYRDDVFPLPAADARFDPHDYPPMFDFSECQTCTVGAAYGERYHGSGVALFCTNKQLYTDKMSRGIEKFLAWRDARSSRDRSEDLGLVEAMAADLSVGMAEIITMSNLEFAAQGRYVLAWGDGHKWQRYNLVPAAAELFGALVGAPIPDLDYFERERFTEHLETFFGAPPESFDWRQSAACLLVWRARVWAGLGVELATPVAVAMATATEEVAA